MNLKILLLRIPTHLSILWAETFYFSFWDYSVSFSTNCRLPLWPPACQRNYFWSCTFLSAFCSPHWSHRTHQNYGQNLLQSLRWSLLQICRSFTIFFQGLSAPTNRKNNWMPLYRKPKPSFPITVILLFCRMRSAKNAMNWKINIFISRHSYMRKNSNNWKTIWIMQSVRNSPLSKRSRLEIP